MNISSRIKYLRNEHHLTQKELAKMLNVKPTTISGWELGRNEPSIDTLEKLSSLFNVSTEYLIGGEDNSSNTIDLKTTDVLSYDGKPVSPEDLAIIRAILERNK
ncbi:helix-turn-helix domain-containing protein [Lactobacillus jensenii]|uniref:helix-turn-helix domain-containing protein n=1 Tax=Lactobacillus jensenii TaxID=109790 RepID=UPI001F3D4048|nr:helix-turn-helix transcriptional regulator [Lactobacillus jensenii]MCF1778509.1 helix-turn-helix domain-containing protein [Lactobacillus jensenii]